MKPGREQASREVSSPLVDSETVEVRSASTQGVSRSVSASLGLQSGLFPVRYPL